MYVYHTVYVYTYMYMYILYIHIMYVQYICTYVYHTVCTHARMHTNADHAPYTYMCTYVRTYARTYVCIIHTAPTVGVASLQWEWHLYSGSGIPTVGVASLQSVWDYTFTSTRPVPYLQLHMHSNHQYFTPDSPVK